jgi:hypothetical protein
MAVFRVPHHIRAVFREYSSSILLNEHLERSDPGGFFEVDHVENLLELHNLIDGKVSVVQRVQHDTLQQCQRQARYRLTV